MTPGDTAAGMAAAAAGGEVSVREIVAAHLAAVEDAAGLNAFTSVEADAALARGAHLDDALARSADPGPLWGVPIALKDLVDHAGRTTTCGSSFYRHRADATATCVARLEAAGAVVIGRTGLHEFAFGFSSENDWFGPIRNPWDRDTSPGGSSGGSAAAVAAGLAPIGIGTDTGGSVRVPAAMCGIVGLKVTHGRIPLTGVFPLAPSLDTVGPLTRTVGDAALAYAAMAGDDPADPWSAPRPAVLPDGPAPLAGLRIALPREWIDRPLASDVGSGLAWAVARLEEAGAIVADVSDPLLTPPGMIEQAAYGEVATVHGGWFAEDPGRYGDAVRDRLGDAVASDPVEFARARAWQAGLQHAFERVFVGHDLVLTPTAASVRKVIGEERVDTGDGPESYRRALSWFSALVNHARLPALSLPLAVEGSPPPSIQLVGPAWSEDRLLATGLALEHAGIVAVRPPRKGS